MTSAGGAAKISFSFGGSSGGVGTEKGNGANATASGSGSQSNLALLMSRAQTGKPAGAKGGKALLLGGDEDEDGEDHLPEAMGGRGSGSRGGSKVARPKPSLLSGPPSLSRPSPSTTSGASAPSAVVSRSERKLQETAISLDPSAFQYDEVYDQLKASSLAVESRQKAENAERKPKYIENFLASAQTRRLDKLHAEEKAMQREREKEGGEFDDKDKFVTGAYKAQMEQVRQAEEEERKREDELRKSRKGPGLTAFYKSMLDDSEAIHAAAVAATSTSSSSTGPSLAIRPPAPPPPVEDDEAEYDPFLAAEAKASRSSRQEEAVDINDDGEVVDKRSLLRAGLNITKKPKAVVSLPNSLLSGSRGGAGGGGGGGGGGEGGEGYQSRAVGSAAGHTERLRREKARLDQQLREEEHRKRASELERREKEEEEARRRREGVDGEAEKRRIEAKERYLARKRAREGEAAGEGEKKAKAGDGD